MSIISGIGDIVSDVFRQLFGFLATVAVFVIVAYIIIKIIVRYKKARMVSEEQNSVLVMGKQLVKQLRLGNMYTSMDNKKAMKIGKIVSYVKGEEDDGTPVDIFAIRKGIGEFLFYKVLSDRHSPLFSDVILYDWNFRLDAESKYMIDNSDTTIQSPIEKLLGDNETGVDSIGLLSPTIHKAVQVNPQHRIQLRITKLIKIPDETALAMADQLNQYTEGGG